MTKKYVIILQNNKSRKLYLKDLTAMSYKVRLQIPLQPPYEDKKEEQDEPSPVEPGFTFEPFSCTLPPIKIEW